MVVNLSVPDELYSEYVKMSPTNPGRAMVKQLKRFSEVNPGSRAVVVAGDDLVAIQRLTDKSIETPADLMALIEEALHVKSEDVKVRFTEAQRKRLRQEAQFWSTEPGKYASEKLQGMINTAFGA